MLINVYVASPDPDPNPRGGGQLPNPNECNSTLTSGTSGGTAPTYTIYTGAGGQFPNPKSAILLYANECNKERETLTPNPNECNSTLTSGTNNIYPYPCIDVNDRGHCFRLGSPLTNYPHSTSYSYRQTATFESAFTTLRNLLKLPKAPVDAQNHLHFLQDAQIEMELYN